MVGEGDTCHKAWLVAEFAVVGTADKYVVLMSEQSCMEVHPVAGRGLHSYAGHGCFEADDSFHPLEVQQKWRVVELGQSEDPNVDVLYLFRRLDVSTLPLDPKTKAVEAQQLKAHLKALT